MSRHYRKYEPLPSRLRRMSRYPFAALSGLCMLLALWRAASALLEWRAGSAASAVGELVFVVLPVSMLAAIFFVGYRWARGAASFGGVLAALLATAALAAFFAALSSIQLKTF
ncbi:hypothetical protein SAMN04487939_1275 [Lysobacter sp. yr284]|uniref:hypothetical protein n=1 Tax=Lysobacter sp. yr284 TaxID=1761791 RepID=UPI000894345B|nr:hypothetical protein [Lysobacter sp. yr284]SDZ25161.1 hypothetical protein SAMN04487939_1275 [Lysobacter sp. yr284]